MSLRRMSLRAPRCVHSNLPTACIPALLYTCRSLRHRSLAADDPFGESSASNDPSDGPYAAWSGADLDAFASAASSDEVRAAHFGPEWSRFTTIGRMSVKMMRENRGGNNKENNKERPVTAEEMHERELQARRRTMERNYATYEEYVEKELAATAAEDEREVDGAVGESQEAMPLPKFMTTAEGKESDTTTAMKRPTTDKSFARRRGGLQAPEPLMQVILEALGEPHGDKHLPRTDPMHWNTDEIVYWLRKMEAARFSQACAATAGAENDGCASMGMMLETPLMEDPAMQEAFYMARANGEFLLHHTSPNTLFQVMRRWYLRRQEIHLSIIGGEQEENNNNNYNDAIIRNAVENGRKKLDEAASKVTPLLIQETISQCYMYCH